MVAQKSNDSQKSGTLFSTRSTQWRAGLLSHALIIYTRSTLGLGQLLSAAISSLDSVHALKTDCAWLRVVLHET